MPLLRRMADSYWDGLMPTADTVRTPEVRSSYFEARFRDESSQTCLAEVGDAIIGFLRVTRADRRVTVTDFFVDAGHRRQGYGRAMVHAIQAVFDRLGVEEISLTSRRDNPEALGFWEADGFMVGHYELKQFRDPATGRAFVGALSSDFDPPDVSSPDR
ncbi:GNAT family N-acetyltransferase [Candidatus Latescibacterota bacterium]